MSEGQMIKDHNAIIIISTYPNDSKKLKQLITAILKKKLAGCIQRINYMSSYYLRENKIKKTQEKLLLMKTTEDKKYQLIEFYKKMHPYETPEIIVIKPDEVNQGYVDRLSGL